ncbi:MAG: hypothetical protein PHW41_00350 [Eubacteriales bacterium]|nr:hypothetical protein [Eubacteriales bacterium]
MVKDLPQRCVPEVCAKVWPLSQDPAYQFYPLFKSEEDIKDTLSWTMESDATRAYGYWRERVLEGMCCLFIEEEQHYVLIIALYSWGNFKTAANAFLRQIFAEFPGYEIETGIAGEHTLFREKLTRSGFRLQDDRFNMRHPLPAQIAQENRSDLELRMVTRETLEEYGPLHDSWFYDSRWSAEDLEHSLVDSLIVTARRDGRIIGAVFTRCYERVAHVRGLHAEDDRLAKALLIEAMRLSVIRIDPIEAMEWMIQRSDPFLAVLYDLGFAQSAHYTFYRREMSE